MSAEPDTLDLDLVVTLDDQIAFVDHAVRQPSVRRRRLLGELAVVCCAPAMIPLGFCIGWITDPQRENFGAFVADNFLNHADILLRFCGAAVVFMVLWMMLGRLLQRGRRRRWLRRVLRERGDVDTADPSLPQRVRVSFGPDGIASATSLGSSVTSWAAIKRCDETPSHVFLFSGLWSGLIVPKRSISADESDVLKLLIGRHVARPV